MTLEREISWLIKEKYGGVVTKEAERDIERLKAGEHVAYVIGFVEFLGARIDLSRHPLIPRPETEHWAGEALKALSKKPDLRVLDIFAGSGCIGIAVLKRLPEAHVDFSEISPDFCAQIEKNLELNGIPAERAAVIRSDVFSNIKDSYDAIFANPPYIPEGRALDASVMSQEPHGALFAGPDGLHFIRRLIGEAPAHLNPGGVLYIEFDSPQKEAIETIAREAGWEIQTFRDQYGAWRWASLTR